MAIARASALIGAVSGSLGSITAKNTPAGLVIAKRVTKVNQKTAPQLAQRARYHLTIRDWQSLDAQHRKTWVRLAQTFPHKNSLGVSRALSGFQLFTKYRLIRRNIWPATPTDFPLGLTSIPVADVSLDFEEDDHYKITLTVAVDPNAYVVAFYFGRSFSSSRPKFFNNYRFFSYPEFGSGSPGTVDFFPDLDSLLGAPKVLEWVFCRLVTFNRVRWQSQKIDLATRVTG